VYRRRFFRFRANVVFFALQRVLGGTLQDAQ
jgi:hypothetical protein